MINQHKSNKIKENSNTVRHLNNGTDHRHSKSCCDQSSPARRTMIEGGLLSSFMWSNGFINDGWNPLYEKYSVRWYFVMWSQLVKDHVQQKTKLDLLKHNRHTKFMYNYLYVFWFMVSSWLGWYRKCMRPKYICICDLYSAMSPSLSSNVHL